ncbi:(3R)-3-hydroxyacyl-CoA dehydrogenase isoform X2 [Pipistrellus kuhlii]|uniref:(3R)-3-hydroxyacyl-CoA dehydrogenase isoform X2 n=1 Tax=Pipistrellus kuhlii TaxID=59472 RepID=UPI001E26F493|nr:(3R)-3-hydroxyacyl-CoA dehydrogenase isoform X2 [Pipistrellus kuhlii]
MATPLRLGSALALVTGAGSGIGRAVSVRLAREGAAVAACDLDGAAAQETVRLLGGPGGEEGAPRGAHAAFQADVSEAGAARRLLEQVQACFSRPPSVVVSCAGITRDEFLLHMSEDDWDKVIAVNLKVGNLGQTNYSASKAGVMGLTQTVARELGRHGIRCNSVLPGFITTPMTQKVPQKVLDKTWQMWSHSWHLMTVDTSPGPQWKSLEDFSCNCLQDRDSARPPPLRGLLLLRTEFPGYKRGGSVWLRNAEYGRQGCL